MTYSDDPIALLFELQLGPWLTPLRGKVPILSGWQSLPPVDEPTVREWFAKGHNLGFRTGAKSGLIVIDDDQCKHAANGYTPPPTGLIARSPTGSTHHYYRAPQGECPRNSASKLAPYVDVRGEGGQVVVPPSLHPVEPEDYRWAALGEPAPWPVVQIDMSALATAAAGLGYAQTALVREAAQVRVAPEGARNDTLNKAAFNLGQLVAGGQLSADAVRAELVPAALIAGLPEREALATVANGLAGGAKSPRTAPPPRPSTGARRRHPAATLPPPHSAPQSGRAEVLIPGSHTLPTGEYKEQGCDSFSAQAIAALPLGAVYRRANTVGTVEAGIFREINSNALRSVVDASMRLIGTKTTDDEPTIVYRTCMRDHADVILAAAQRSERVPSLVEIVRAPVLLPGGRILDRAGFDLSSGVLLDPLAAPLPVPETPTWEDVREAVAALFHPFEEFPLSANSDYAALLAYMLALAASPAIAGPLPGLLVTAPSFGAGKGLLVRAATIAMCGAEPKLGTFPSGREAEVEIRKLALSSLIDGCRAIIVDNVRDGSTLRSETVASILTSVEWTDRILGNSVTVTVPARAAWAFSGVNVTLHDDLARRFCRVRIEPRVEHAAARTFQIKDLLAHVTQHHPSLICAALTVLRAFQQAGAPAQPEPPLGSFEAWDAIVRSAVVWVTGFDPCEGIHAAQALSPEHAGLAGLLSAWADSFPNGATAAEAARWVSSCEPLKGALEALGLLDDRGDANTRRLGIRLREWEGRTIGELRFVRAGERHSAVIWKAAPADA